MRTTNIILWGIVVVLFIYSAALLWVYLRSKDRRPRLLLSLIATSIIAVAALIGVINLQVYAIDIFKTRFYPLFFVAIFVPNIFFAWTQPSWQQQHSHKMRMAFLVFGVVYVLFMLVLVIWNP